MDGSLLRAEPENLETGSQETGLAGPESHDPTAELDLERLVWDPEYRKAMRHLIKRGS